MLYLNSPFFKIVEQKLRRFERISKEEVPGRGWIYTIRKALKMPVSCLAKRLSITQGRVSQIEKQERDASLTLKNMQRIADALDCNFVYALIPKAGSLEKTLDHHADAKAQAIMEDTLKTMALEGQIPHDLNAQHRAIKQELLMNKTGELWK